MQTATTGACGWSRTGIIQAFAGTGATGYGDGGPAASAIFGSSLGALAVSGTGTVYIADSANHRVRAVGLDSVITTVAGHGGFDALASGNEGMATAAGLATPTALAVDGQGQLFIGDTATTPCAAWTSAASSTPSPGIRAPEGATQATVASRRPASLSSPTSLAVARDGALYILDFDAVRVVDSTGAIALVAGNSGSVPSCTDSGAALATRLAVEASPRPSPRRRTGSSDLGLRLLRLSAADQEARTAAPRAERGMYRIPSDDGGDLDLRRDGRHLDTREARTGDSLVSFGYEAVASRPDGRRRPRDAHRPRRAGKSGADHRALPGR